MKRRYVYFIAGLALFQCIIAIYHSHDRFVSPFPYWMMTYQWYDELLQAIWFATIVVACLVYDLRHRPVGNDRGASVKKLWRDKLELRTVLYCLAAIQIASFLIAFPKDLQALRNNPPSWCNTFLSLFPFDTVFAAGIGIAIIVYDRLRIRREAKEDATRCHICNYDLRATPDRCPECGTIPPTQRGSFKPMNSKA